MYSALTGFVKARLRLRRRGGQRLEAKVKGEVKAEAEGKKVLRSCSAEVLQLKGKDV